MMVDHTILFGSLIIAGELRIAFGSRTEVRESDRPGLFLDLAPFCKLTNVIGSAERKRLNRHGGLATTGSHEARSVAQEQVRYIVRAMIFVDHGSCRIVAHAAGTQQVD